ncbi:replication protein A 70 kDa DNA-binding subunit-like [Saccostrea echinata]|uniref:replication protein A 70 kDa DNA-binding subunit-like n=1 Tax=Saccostrea echinata TaxID=191078 RepID=UPI002A80DB4C|nr:replication protein A 70 kDa DNA-binding subunit-like [Saccostrea echinata]
MEGKDLTTIKNIKDDCVVTFLATVKARTQVRVWSRNKSTGKIMTGILMDRSGSIDFVCWTEGAMKFDGILKENLTYKFIKAKSVFAKENYSKTKHCCQIILDKNSEIEEVESEPLVSPIDITPIAELASKENQQKVTVVGKVLAIPQAERLGSTGVDIVKVRIQDNSGTIQLSLMGNEIKNCNFSINDVLLLENAELRIYGMLRCLQGSTGIRTVNPSDRDYTQYMPGPDSPNIDLSPGKNAPKEKTVITLNKDEGRQKIHCSVLETNLRECTYERCPKVSCRSRVVCLSNGLYRCNKCESDYFVATTGVRLILHISQEKNNEKKIVMFNDMAEQFTEKSAAQLLVLEEVDILSLEKALMSNQYKFTLSPAKSNSEFLCESFVVQKGQESFGKETTSHIQV